MKLMLSIKHIQTIVFFKLTTEKRALNPRVNDILYFDFIRPK